MKVLHNRDPDRIQADTLAWIRRAVIGLNLCPFARSVIDTQHLQIVVENSSDPERILTTVCECAVSLTSATDEATGLVILADGYNCFDDYLDLVALCEQLFVDLGFEGVLQIASFHPHYVFEGSNTRDAANYTNRSPYPMLHLLQELAVEKAVSAHRDTLSIPDRNREVLRGLTEPELLALTVGETSGEE